METSLISSPAQDKIEIMSKIAEHDTESEILKKVIEADRGGMAPEAARAFLSYRFDETAIARINALAEKNRQGTLTEAERTLLESYLGVGNFLNLLHAKARCALIESGSSNAGRHE